MSYQGFETLPPESPCRSVIPHTVRPKTVIIHRATTLGEIGAALTCSGNSSGVGLAASNLLSASGLEFCGLFSDVSSTTQCLMGQAVEIVQQEHQASINRLSSHFTG